MDEMLQVLNLPLWDYRVFEHHAAKSRLHALEKKQWCVNAGGEQTTVKRSSSSSPSFPQMNVNECNEWF